MTTITRRSPKLPPNWGKQEIRDAIETLEDRARVPEKTPASSSANGFEGEFCADGSYIYVYMNGTWKRAALASF